jgi:hypothetical protein
VGETLDEEVVYVVFRGTSGLLDILTDACAVPLLEEKLNLSVHSGMWSSLHSKGRTMANIRAQLRGLPRSKKERRHLVLTGHSLGGGYAVLAGLELLAWGAANDSGEFWLDPRIVTFGSPMVLNTPEKDENTKLWSSLGKRTVSFVHAWDCVPRLPSCERYVFDVLTAPEVTGKHIGFGVHVGIVTRNFVKEHIKPIWGTLSGYSPCGTIVCFDDSNPGQVMTLDFDSSGPEKQLDILGRAPLPPDSFVLKQHAMER